MLNNNQINKDLLIKFQQSLCQFSDELSNTDHKLIKNIEDAFLMYFQAAFNNQITNEHHRLLSLQISSYANLSYKKKLQSYNNHLLVQLYNSEACFLLMAVSCMMINVLPYYEALKPYQSSIIALNIISIIFAYSVYGWCEINNPFPPKMGEKCVVFAQEITGQLLDKREFLCSVNSAK